MANSTRLLSACLLGAGLGLSPAVFSADAQAIAFTCYGCHGHGGVSHGSVPSLKRDAAYIEQSLKAFRDGQRPATIMDRLTRGYTDEEIAAVARYFGNLQ